MALLLVEAGAGEDDRQAPRRGRAAHASPAAAGPRSARAGPRCRRPRPSPPGSGSARPARRRRRGRRRRSDRPRPPAPAAARRRSARARTRGSAARSRPPAPAPRPPPPAPTSPPAASSGWRGRRPGARPAASAPASTARTPPPSPSGIGGSRRTPTPELLRPLGEGRRSGIVVEQQGRLPGSAVEAFDQHQQRQLGAAELAAIGVVEDRSGHGGSSSASVAQLALGVGFAQLGLDTCPEGEVEDGAVEERLAPGAEALEGDGKREGRARGRADPPA